MWVNSTFQGYVTKSLKHNPQTNPLNNSYWSHNLKFLNSEFKSRMNKILKLSSIE